MTCPREWYHSLSGSLIALILPGEQPQEPVVCSPVSCAVARCCRVAATPKVYITCKSPRNHAACVGNYCNAILSSEIIAGRYVQLAVERHLDDLKHAHERGLHFDAEIAGKSLRFV